MRHRLALALPGALVFIAGAMVPVQAQMVTGTLTNARTGEPVAGAQVTLVADDGRVVASESSGYAGEFFLSPEGTGSFRIRAALPGYRPGFSAPFELEYGDTLTVRIRLSNVLFVLDTVEVIAGQRAGARPHMARAFYDRLEAASFGVFITREDIEIRRPARTTDLLRTVPGVQLAPTRGEGYSMRVRANCSPTVYIDGTRAHMGNLTLDDLVRPAEIEGIEVYRSISEAPVQYRGMNAGCSAILVWTRISN